MSLNKVAVFGNTGGGKSALSRRLAEITSLPLYVLDIIQFREGRYRAEEKHGGKLPIDEYLTIHRDILGRDQWIIDGYGTLSSTWERLSAADTLIYVDLPIHAHYWGVTKRWATGLFRNPTGWPENSPVWESTFDSLQVVWRCHQDLTPKYRQFCRARSTVEAGLPPDITHCNGGLPSICRGQAVELTAGIAELLLQGTNLFPRRRSR